MIEEALIERLVDLVRLNAAQLHAAYGMNVEKIRPKKWKNLANEKLYGASAYPVLCKTMTI